MSRVVVTGLGVVSPIGLTAPSYWTSLVAGTSGFGPITLVPQADADRLVQKIAAEVKGFDPATHFDQRRLATLDRVSQFAIVAAREAIADAGMAISDRLAEQTAVVIGCAVGGQTTVDESASRIYRDQKKRISPLTIPKLMVNAPASQISMDCGLGGPAFVVASACASATHAIGLAFHMIRAGHVPRAVAGGAEACVTLATLMGWDAMRLMAPDACRPFSRYRKGMVLGEGAAIVVLESMEHASSRGAAIYGEIVGFGMSADARDLTAPDEGGMVRAINAALLDGSMSRDDIDYVNAHGTGTAANDETETRALKQAFGAHSGKLAISSTKSMVGHALGAAGALELVAMLMATRESIVPPTIGYLGPDPVCDLDYVPNQARPMQIDAAVSNSFAFGGLNAVLAVRRFG